MGYATYIGRVGGLAIALGVGVAIATMPGVASADGTDSSSSASSSSSSSAGSSGSTGSSDSSSGSNTESSGSTGSSETSSGEVAKSNSGATQEASSDDAPKVGNDGATNKKSTPVVKNKKSGSDTSDAAAAPKKPKRSMISTPSGSDTTGEPGVTTQSATTDTQPKVESVKAPAVEQLTVVDVAPKSPVTISSVQDVAPAEPQPTPEVTPLTSTLLSAAGQSPSADGDSPDLPGDSPLTLLGLAAFKRQTQDALTEDAPAEPKLMVAALTTNSAPTVGAQPTGIPNASTGVVSSQVIASDVDGNTLTYSVSGTSANGGTVTINSTTGAYTYTPSASQRLAAGTTTGADVDTFTVSVSDGLAVTTGTVPVYVSPTQITTGTPITVGNQPDGIAVDPTKNRIYVINQYDKTVSVIDGNPNSATYNKVIAPPLKLASTPSDIVVNSDGTRAYVALKGNATVAVIDTATMKLVDVNPSTSTVDGIKVGSTPVGMAIYGNRLYVTNAGSGTVSVIDATTNKLVDMNPSTTTVDAIKVGSQPDGIAVSPTGDKLYVTLRYTDKLAVVDLAAPTAAPALIAVGDSPREVVLNKLGTRAYVTNYDGTVTVVDTTAKQRLATIVTGGPKYQPAGVAIDGDRGLVYVANGKDTVSVIDANTNKLIRNIAIDSAPESGAHYIALSADGTRIYVTDLNDDNVRTLSLTRGNTAPVAIANPTVGTPSSSTGAVTGLVNLKDPDGDAVTLSTVAGPSNGSVSYNASTGTYTYTPTFAARQQVGLGGPTTDSFTVRASDPSGAFKDASVTVPITGVQAIPVSTTATGVGLNPSDVVVSGNYAYTANAGSWDISVVDTRTNSVVGTIGLDSYPYSMAVSKDGKRLYVTDYNNIAVIDTVSQQNIGTIEVPYVDDYPYRPTAVTDIEVSPTDSNVIYALRSYYNEFGDAGISSSVSRIDTATGAVTTTWTTYLQDIEVSPTQVYGADGGGYGVYVPAVRVYDATTLAESSPIRTPAGDMGSQPGTSKLALSSDGKRLYALVGPWESPGKVVSVIDTSTKTQIAAVSVPSPSGARDIVVGPDGTVYLAQSDGQTVALIDPESLQPEGSFVVDQSNQGWKAIAVGPDGTIYVVDYYSNTLYAIKLGSQSQASNPALT